jgi:regulator of protease activity HflC (stomatin/prohibitin superfamily)
MNEDRISAARADMERRVAEFRETQAKFQRERDDYYETTIEKVRATHWNEFVMPRSERQRSERQRARD